MSNTTLLGALALFTLLAVMIFGFWQYGSVRSSQKRRGEETGTLQHHNLSTDGDFVVAPTPSVDEGIGAAGRHPEPVGADATRSADRPAA